MRARGETIATAVARTTPTRKGEVPRTALLRPDRLLPLLQELEPLLLIQRLQDLRPDRDRLQYLSELLVERRGGGLALHVVAAGEQRGLGEQLLPALPEQALAE